MASPGSERIGSASVGTDGSATAVRPSRLRWLVMAIVVLFELTIQLDFLTYALDAKRVSAALDVSLASIGYLTSIPALVNLSLLVPCGWLADRVGMRPLVLAGGGVLIAGATLRLAWTDYTGLAIAQIVLACAGPLVGGALAPFLRRWIPAREHVRANMLYHASKLGGVTLAFLIVPRLYASFGFPDGLRTLSIAVLVLGAAVILVMPRDPADPFPVAPKAWHATFAFVRDGTFLGVAGLFFTGNVFFNGLLVWLSTILGGQGISPTDAGLVGTAMIVGAFVGTLALPPVAVWCGRPKLTLVLAGLPVFPAVASLLWQISLGAHAFAVFFIGFSMASGAPIFYTWITRAVRADLGKALALLGVLMSAGAALGAALLPHFANGGDWTGATWFLAALLTLSGFVLVLTPTPPAPETSR